MARKISDEKIIEASNRFKSMSSAASSLNLPLNTFKRKAKKLGCYNPNQAGKGINKNYGGPKKELSDILSGKVKYHSTSSLKRRLLKEGIKKNKCEECGIDSWNDKPLSMHLDHVNGNNTDNRIDNLKMLCPNCHSQTSTYAGKSKRKRSPLLQKRIL